MKNTLSIIFLILFNLTFKARAQASNEGRGGGDVLVMNFQMAGEKVCTYLKTAQNRTGISTSDFCNAVQKVRVTSEESTYLDDGTEVDAINIPSQSRIKLSQNRNFGKTMKDLIQLSAHEYISVLGIDDKSYQISGPLTLKIDGTEDQFSERGECPPLKATYQCDAPYPSKFTIVTKGDIFTMKPVDLGRNYTYTPQVPFAANDQEQQIDYVPAGPDRDVPYVSSVAARCTGSGFEMKIRNNDFTPLNPRTGKYELAGNTTAFYRFAFNHNLSRLIINSRIQSLSFKTGQVTEYKDMIRCQRVD
jgi:hypothetical protein